ncbi:hypothetical protein K4K51_001707 [Colletotrichum sp. SAR 10_75]|nr:hypothetical protein K4K51_001707 [Colletotrichum sp. SAR 10_75]
MAESAQNKSLGQEAPECDDEDQRFANRVNQALRDFNHTVPLSLLAWNVMMIAGFDRVDANWHALMVFGFLVLLRVIVGDLGQWLTSLRRKFWTWLTGWRVFNLSSIEEKVLE